MECSGSDTASTDCRPTCGHPGNEVLHRWYSFPYCLVVCISLTEAPMHQDCDACMHCLQSLISLSVSVPHRLCGFTWYNDPLSARLLHFDCQAMGCTLGKLADGCFAVTCSVLLRGYCALLLGCHLLHKLPVVMMAQLLRCVCFLQ